ncbi:hypothetical protein [Spirosoma aerolatum]|uniref:hypothetical protein n=1 Tax=Spirosoma aerolatum TaxID=1211326 RepID=UPI0009ADEDA4|nr:hypothetical protein [Spirosoma aerolatum]
MNSCVRLRLLVVTINCQLQAQTLLRQVTMKLDGSWVRNQLVVSSIRQLLDIDFNTLGLAQ